MQNGKTERPSGEKHQGCRRKMVGHHGKFLSHFFPTRAHSSFLNPLQVEAAGSAPAQNLSPGVLARYVEDVVDEAFGAHDRDHNGLLSPSEFSSWVAEHPVKAIDKTKF